MRLLFLILFLPFISIGQNNLNPSRLADTRTATVIIYREKSDTAHENNTLVELNNEPFVTMINGSFASYNLRPGRYTFRLAVNPPAEASIMLEADESYYLRIRYTQENDQLQATLEFVDQDTYRQYMGHHWLMRIARKNMVKDSINMLKMRMNQSGQDIIALSLILGSGIGFSEVPMVTLTNGNNASISGGGGGEFGISLIYRFTPFLDVLGELTSQSSYLTPTVKNADVTFSRFTLGLATRYSQALGKRWRLNLGPGITSYQSPKMTADLKKLINGFKGVFKYNPSTGFSLAGEGEYFFKNYSMSMGMKWVSNEYSMKSATIDGYSIPIDDPELDDLRKLDGSGYYFYWTFRFHL